MLPQQDGPDARKPRAAILRIGLPMRTHAAVRPVAFRRPLWSV